MEGVKAFILSMKRESQNKAYTVSPTKNMKNLPSTIKRFTLICMCWLMECVIIFNTVKDLNLHTHILGTPASMYIRSFIHTNHTLHSKV